MSDASRSPATRAVTAGRGDLPPGDPLNPPVVFASTYAAGGAVGYARSGNPTWSALETAIGALEDGEALAYASGLAAAAGVLDLLPAGAVVVAPAVAYTGVRELLEQRVVERKLHVRWVPMADADEIAGAVAGADLLWLESPTNPLLDICDLRAAAAAAHEVGALTVVDNTFATPLGQRPLDLGADVSLHSATKQLSGHSDLLLGAVIVRDQGLRDRLADRRTLLGAVPGPMEAWLALRGIRTLAVRHERACANAAELAARLAAHPAVHRVRYPGLPGDPGHTLASDPDADVRVHGRRGGRRRCRPGRAGVRRHPAVGARHEPGGRGVLAGAPAPLAGRDRRGPREPAAALGRHRRRRGPVARPRRGAVVRRLRLARAYARSDFQGRDMSAPKTSRGLSPWCTTWTTCSVIGISTPCWQARS